jgi:hypothetical protein
VLSAAAAPVSVFAGGVACARSESEKAPAAIKERTPKTIPRRNWRMADANGIIDEVILVRGSPFNSSYSAIN